MPSPSFPPMPAGFEPTRASLHAYARAVGAIPRLHAVPHPKWWHISLRVTPLGLVTDAMAAPDGGTFQLRMDLHAHDVVLERSTGAAQRFTMQAGMTGTEMGEALIAAVAQMGLDGDYTRDKFASDEARTYDPASAEDFFAVLTDVHHVLHRHRAGLGDSVGPLQVWPHGFDLAFEWFGTRVETYEEHGEVRHLPSQINFGFYPGGEPYLYANPWPFEEALVSRPLPAGVAWHTEGWQGTMLPYAAVAGDPAAGDRILEYAETVFEVASPGLTA